MSNINPHTKYKLLIASKYADDYRTLLEAAELPGLEIVERDALPAECDIVFGEPSLIKPILPGLPTVNWIQSTFAGVDPLLDPTLRRDYMLTNMRGVFGGLMSEFIIGYLLLHERKILQRLEAQKKRQWDATLTGTLREKTIGLLSVASIGAEVARTAKFFGMTVRGYTRESEASQDVDQYFHGEELFAFALGVDYLVNILPNTSATQCPDAYCDGWTALGGAPGTVQRKGFMWDPPNDTYAAYCNPSLSGRGICALQHNCSGPGMIQDGTFGTHWEFTPGAGANDYINLSTNYGSGPNTPPNLCPAGGPDDCVTAAAVIFFNVPVKWTTNQSCSFTTAAQSVTGLQCLTANCTDAYTHPTDDKQCACPSSATRGYRVEFCPSGSPLPATPG